MKDHEARCFWNPNRVCFCPFDERDPDRECPYCVKAENARREVRIRVMLFGAPFSPVHQRFLEAMGELPLLMAYHDAHTRFELDSMLRYEDAPESRLWADMQRIVEEAQDARLLGVFGK